ncbi:unnamed protein product [Parajaminaea phylloscopi]
MQIAALSRSAKSATAAGLAAAPPQVRPRWRRLSTRPAAREQHLLWAGTLLDRTTGTHSVFDHELLLAAGAADDLDKGDISLVDVAASPTRGHSLIAYRTAAPDRLTRVLALGRNTHGQLGLGYASQEATFGLVRPGFSGAGGISSVLAGPAQTWILTKGADDRPSSLFACGNNTLGQLGCQIVKRSSPQLDLHPSPRAVSVDDKGGRRIVSFAAGLDHTLLVEKLSALRSGQVKFVVSSTGLNTDGQLGRLLTKPAKFADVGATQDDSLRPVADLSFDAEVPDSTRLHVSAGGDTSFCWTREVGRPSRVWSWGNNEYEQCLVPGRAQSSSGLRDQIAVPTEVSTTFAASLGPESCVEDIKIGGSWVVVVDSLGRVFAAGLGVSGDTSTAVEALTQVAGLPSIDSLYASVDAIMALSKCRRRLFVWGIDGNGGVLGLGAPEHRPVASVSGGGPSIPPHEEMGRYAEPRELDMHQWLGPAGEIESAALGGEQSWIIVEDNEEPRGVWRGSQSRDLTLA